MPSTFLIGQPARLGQPTHGGTTGYSTFLIGQPAHELHMSARQLRTAAQHAPQQHRDLLMPFSHHQRLKN
jgi:hypothetical protein